tara:strand:+ start:121 stop:489 length:369 start_codon:yes stop_codon:yes gene_type:complete
MLGRATEEEVSNVVESKLSELEARLTEKIEQALSPLTSVKQDMTQDNNTSGIGNVEDHSDPIVKQQEVGIAKLIESAANGGTLIRIKDSRGRVKLFVRESMMANFINDTAQYRKDFKNGRVM